MRLTAAQEDPATKIFRARYVARSYPIQQALIVQSIEVQRNVRKLNQKMDFMESVRRGISSSTIRSSAENSSASAVSAEAASA